MRPKLDNEHFCKLLKLFFNGLLVTSLSVIDMSILVFELYNLKMVIPISCKKFQYAVNILIGYGA